MNEVLGSVVADKFLLELYQFLERQITKDELVSHVFADRYLLLLETLCKNTPITSHLYENLVEVKKVSKDILDWINEEIRNYIFTIINEKKA